MIMLDKRWQDEYVRTPEHFRFMVEQTVKSQVQSEIMINEKKTEEKRHIWWRSHWVRAVAVCSLVLLVLLGSNHVIANYDSIYKWIASLGANQKKAGEILITDVTTETASTEESRKEEPTGIITEEIPPIFKLYGLDPEIAAEAVQKTPSLDLESVYIDGTYLVFTANLSKNAEGPTPGNAKDHVLVNGQDCLLVYFKEEPLGSNHYECKIDLSYADNLEGDEVEVSLFLMPVENFTFKVKIGENFKETRRLAAQTIDLGDNGKVNVEKLTLSPSQLTVKMHFELKGENAEKLSYAYAAWYMKLIDSKENADAKMQWMEIGDSITQKDGTVTKDVTIAASGFDADSDTLTIVPCNRKWDEKAGKYISGTEEWLNENAFTISLKESKEIQ